MGLAEIVLIGIGLAMDAFAVTITNVLGHKLTKKGKISMPIAFGFFQFLMPVIGYFGGNLFSGIIDTYAGIVTCVVLGYIGGNMIKEAFAAMKNPKENPMDVEEKFTIKILIMQAIATSIDAFAVGVSFAAMHVNIWTSSLIILVITALLCSIALYIGKKFGEILGERAEIVGGLILIFIGIKSLF